MAMKLLQARAFPDNTNPKEFRFSVHLDDSKLDKEGNPSSEFVEQLVWGYDARTDGPRAAFLAMAKREAKLLCQDQLQRRSAAETPPTGVALAGEGQAF